MIALVIPGGTGVVCRIHNWVSFVVRQVFDQIAVGGKKIISGRW